MKKYKKVFSFFMILGGMVAMFFMCHSKGIVAFWISYIPAALLLIVPAENYWRDYFEGEK
jgi:ABC-type Na+ efflux pump permease subunit